MLEKSPESRWRKSTKCFIPAPEKPQEGRNVKNRRPGRVKWFWMPLAAKLGGLLARTLLQKRYTGLRPGDVILVDTDDGPERHIITRIVEETCGSKGENDEQ